MAERETAAGSDDRLRADPWLQRHMPIAITLFYIALGVSWILFSDLAVEHFVASSADAARFQTYKGVLYVLLSAVVMYLLLHLYHSRTRQSLKVVSQMAEALRRSENALRLANQDLERRVIQRTHELESANRELESFVHAVSHDLRAPLRGVTGFSQALQDLAPEGLDDKSRHYLKRIQEASQRMAELIDDLLDLSRINQSQLLRQEVDFSSLVADCASRIGERYPGRQVTLHIQPGMTVQGDLRLLRIAMDNLLDNAWKYSAPAPQAVIDVGHEVVDGEQRYYVRDNGVGFDMAYAGKLFGPFQRMHSDAQFPGTGIGLVTVKRILSRHGGRIWADSALNRGTTMSFTLPLAGAPA
jgi:signal transduction histidine kinase